MNRAYGRFNSFAGKRHLHKKKTNLLTHVRYSLIKSPEDWTGFQREGEEMTAL